MARAVGPLTPSAPVGTKVSVSLQMVALALLPTPTAADAKSNAGQRDKLNRPKAGTTLTEAARGMALLPTPMARDGDGRTGGGNNARRRMARRAWPELAGADGPSFVARLPDGTTRDYGPAVWRHAAVLGRRPPAPLAGWSLNGDVSEWMMMFPEGWLDGASN